MSDNGVEFLQQDDMDIATLFNFNLNDIVADGLFLDLLKDDVNEDNILPSPQSSSASSCVEYPSVFSSWIRGIEEKLFDENDNDNNNNNNNVESEAANQQQQQVLPDNFFADLDLPFSHQEKQEVSANPSDEIKVCSSAGSTDLEISDDYFADYLVDVLTEDDQSEEVGVFNDSNSSQSDEVRVFNDENSTPESPESDDAREKESNTATYADKDKDKDDDDPVTKKRKRQMRNRDAAVRSRERKKMYVKDLEVKSKYLEGECIRLQRLLQCCAAENHALHLQLQKEKAFGASRTKQESAVLLLESLLLGSLLWFLGILVMFSPLELHLQLPANKLVNVGSNDQEIVDLVALGRAKSKKIGLGSLRLFFKSKRCKASRSKMKGVTCYGAVVA